MPDRPFVLVGQQYLADPQRSVGNIHPLWTYAHVPNGYQGDATELIMAQIERFAPGFRDCVVGTAVRTTTEMSAYRPRSGTVQYSEPQRRGRGINRQPFAQLRRGHAHQRTAGRHRQ
jgi:phytoene dehydrogenase-like protein